MGYSEIEAFIADLSAAGAIPYGKLFDSRRGAGEFSDAELMSYAGMAAGYRSTAPLGPLAVVIDAETEVVESTLHRLAVIPRPFKVFYEVDDARHWLEQEMAR
ncbi:MAG: hypothetical protein JSR90_08870 [Proteobacteria bacterium]|nr:hypothetical protein [Pseudomonadota bacterium]